MAGKSAAVRVAIIADNSSLKKGLGESESKMKSFGKKVAKVGIVAGGAVAAGLGAIGAAAVKSASDAQQSLGGTQAVFGKYAKGVVATSNGAAKEFGLSANDYRTSANQIGSLLKNQGVSQDKLAGTTKNLVGQASDLAATFGGKTSDAVDALSSAFKGEFDPLEKYGISLKQSTVNAEAMKVAHVKSTGAFNKLSSAQQAAAKRQATQNLITKQSKTAQGQFGKQTNTLAEQQQILSAQFENVKVKIGNVLLPMLSKVFKFITDKAIPAIGKFVDAMKKKLGPVFANVRDKAGKIMDKLKPIADWLRKNPSVIKGAAIALGILAAAVVVVTAAMGLFAIVSSPITLVVVAVLALGAAIAYAYKHSATFRAIVAKVGDVLKTFGRYVVSTVLPAVVKLARKVGGNLKPILTTLARVFKNDVRPAIGKVVAAFIRWWPTIKKVIGFVARLVGKLIVLASKILGKVIPVLIRFAGWIIKHLVPVVIKVIGWIGKFIGKLINLGGHIVNAAKKVGHFADTIRKRIGDAIAWLRKVPGKVKAAFTNAATWLVNAGKNIIKGLIHGITSSFGNVKDKLGDLTGKLTGWKGPPAKDKKLLYQSGQWIIEGFSQGIDDSAPMVKSSLASITGHVQAAGEQASKNLTAISAPALLTSFTGQPVQTTATSGASSAPIPTPIGPKQTPVQVLLDGAVIADHMHARQSMAAVESVRRAP